MSLVSRTALTLLAGLVAVPMTPVMHTSSNTTGAEVPVAYSSSQKEAYLAPDQLTYVRPGFNIKIASVTNFAAGQRPVVEVYLTDDLKGPLDRLGLVTPGVISIRFIAALWNPTTRRYTDYLIASGNPSRDNGTTGTWQELEVGHYKYTFGSAFALPAAMDAAKPHTLAVMGSRNTTDIIGKPYWAVPQYLDFIPATSAVATTFNATVTAKCNQCHDPLALHGGNYRDIKTCVLCHNPNNMVGVIAGTNGAPDVPRVQFDGQIFFHALHMGKNADVVPNITYPQDIRNCETCHDKASAGGASWYTYPSVAACGSCHNDLNFTTGANHAAGPAADGSCTTCHQPQGSVEWDAGIKNAHVVPLHSSQLKGFKASIVSVTNLGPGKKPVVTFKLQNGDGTSVDPGYFKVAANGTLNIIMGGPTTDYLNAGEAAAGQPFREPMQNATYNAADGTAVYTFTNAIPAAAKGTYAFSIETRRGYTLNPAPAKGPTAVNEGAPNQVFYAAVTGTTVTPRRTSVSLTKCNACHQDLYVLFSHGNQRISIEHCVICHNPNGSDIGRRPADGSQSPGESVEFARMIHRIHTGEELAQDYTIYGFGGNPANFNEVTYPGDRRNCLACHVNAAAVSLPLPITNQPVVTDRDFFSPMGSATAACTGCHDSRDVVSHAFINTSFFPKNPTVPAEACGTCHGTGTDLDVAKVHAR